METDNSNYNATVTLVRRIHDDLLILRVAPDFGRLEYLPGQYTLLGLGNWEPHLECEEPCLEKQVLIRRAYSICHSPLDAQGRLQRPREMTELEFYIALVRHSPLHRPLLTPRLFALQPGRRIFVAPHAHGSYTLAGLQRDSHVLFVATGTGEAPHNAMIAELLASEHWGQITSLVCVRRRRDLAYAADHEQLARRYPNYRYVALTTREPENVDAQAPGFVGKQYIQDVLGGANVEQAIGFALAPHAAHVYLCGNPEMIGIKSTAQEQTSPRGAIGVLESRGFTVHSAGHPGNIHFERYF